MTSPPTTLPTVLIAGLLAGSLGSGTAHAQLPTPLAHVQELEAVEGKTLFLKQFSCQAPGKPEALGRLYLIRVNDRSIRAARIEYNEEGKYILETGKSAVAVSGYYDRYVVKQQPFTPFTMNAVLGLWRMFGLKFTLDKVTYQCKVT
ncbi:hypothetical protein [Deinococcus sp.]|uniref:hypothetical protein n=1 Tax=Deinococcus sp. TaxID=47478 RepID=UPI0025C67428|nr:hypothetical protein [Deinococcus sp.]